MPLMAGLIGAVHWQGAVDTLPLPSLWHGGPDANDTWRSGDGRCWLAHQPITSHCGRFTLVFSGAITNHHQVRQGLRFQAWRGPSDRETLVEGLAQRGPAIVLELRGMFAFAAYDSEKEQLLLARDRLGIKPLYLRWHPQGLLFASTRRALPGADRFDRQSISQVLAFGHDRTPASFPGPDTTAVVSMPAGMVVRINHSRPHNPVRYWPPQPRPDWTPLPIRSGHRARTFLRQQLEEVVAQHVNADGAVACLLSAGLNSGILTALACRLQPGAFSTVTVVLPGVRKAERDQPRRLAEHCGSQHHEIGVQEQDALAWVERGLAALDVPTAGGLSTYLISRAVAAQGINVALSAVGADELFGGTAAHRLMPWLHALRWLPAPWRHQLIRACSPDLARKVAGLPRWDRWHLGLALQRQAGDADLAAAGVDPLQWPQSAPQRITQAWGHTSWAELFGSTEPMRLRDADGMATACALELRLPFLDHRLVEIALRMPQRFQRPGQRLLRDACIDLFPTGYLDRPKPGYSLPMASWMGGPLRDLCQGRLETLEHSGWLDPLWISRQWRAFEAGQLPWPRAWSLVVLGEF
ncbi:MAG: hypothetical protein EA413_00190, partial [Cyanobium sp. PLM2.Bin73]